MRLTRFTDYSLRVLIYLAQNNQERVTIHQISEAYGISKNHLMKVVSNLSRLKYIAAQRGPGGGIKLNCLPENITLNEIVGNTEKHLKISDSVSQTKQAAGCTQSRLSGFLQDATRAYLEALSQYTLADILDTNGKGNPYLGMREQAA